MAVSFVGASSAAATTVAIPSHVAGDLIVMFAFRDGSSVTAPTIPAGLGWRRLDIGEGIVGSATSSFAFKIAASDSETSGMWTNATELVCHVYRGGITGAWVRASAESATISYPTLPLSNTAGTSWVAGFAGHRTATDVEQAPTGMTNRTSAGTEAAGHDTNGGVSSWSAQSVTVNASSAWISYMLEIQPLDEIEFVGAASADGTSVSLPSHKAGDFALAWVYRNNSLTLPVPNANWVQIATTQADTQAARLVRRWLTDGETTAGPWANATQVQVLVYRRVVGHGTPAIGGASSSSTLTLPSLTLGDTDGSSWVSAVAGHRTATDVKDRSMTGMTTRTSAASAGSVGGWDQAAVTGNFTGASATVNATAAYRAVTIELLGTLGEVEATEAAFDPAAIRLEARGFDTVTFTEAAFDPPTVRLAAGQVDAVTEAEPTEAAFGLGIIHLAPGSFDVVTPESAVVAFDPPRISLGSGTFLSPVHPGFTQPGDPVPTTPSTKTKVIHRLDGTFTLVRKRGLGAVFHHVVAPDGNSFNFRAEGWEAHEEAPGGMTRASMRISERLFNRRKGPFREQGSLVRSFLEHDGTCVFGGRVYEPEVSGAVQLNIRGWADRAEKEVDRLLLMSRDISAWELSRGDESANTYTTAAQRDLNVGGESGGIAFTHRKVPAAETPTGEFGVYFRADGAVLTRIALKAVLHADPVTTGCTLCIQSSRLSRDNDGVGVTLVRDNWKGEIHRGQPVVEIDVDLNLGPHNLPSNNFGPGIVTDNRIGNQANSSYGSYAPDMVIIIAGDAESMTTEQRRHPWSLELFDIRTNGEAADSDYMSASSLVNTVAGRMGLRWVDEEGSTANILPYDQTEGTYADALDWAALMSGWRWLMLDSGDRPYLEFSPWRKRRWQVFSPHTRLDLIPAERFDSVRVPFLWGDGQTIGYVREHHERPLSVRNTYGKLSLPTPCSTEEQARQFGQRAVRRLWRRRWAGSAQLTEVVGPDGVAKSPHHVHAGDVVDAAAVGGRRGLRIKSLQRTERGVTVTFDGELAALESMVRRRERRLELGVNPWRKYVRGR